MFQFLNKNNFMIKNILKSIIILLNITITSICYGDWKFVGKSDRNISFFVDDNEIVKKKIIY